MPYTSREGFTLFSKARTLLGFGKTEVNKTGKISAFMEFTCSGDNRQ